MEKNTPLLPMGSLCTARLKFQNVQTGQSIESSPRPVLVLRDYGDGKVDVATITSQLEKRAAVQFGYTLENYSDYGLHKKSAVLCTRHNMGTLNRSSLSEPFGKIPLTEVKNILNKMQRLNQKEYNMSHKLVSEIER